MTPFDLEISSFSTRLSRLKEKLAWTKRERSEILALHRLQFETETSLADRVLFQSDYSILSETKIGCERTAD